ncbi:T-cell receptor beta chain ANA 11, putative [Brugia malayi]|nr:T-cell receptor beta chain ANA 11, putative [Brugia malayi]VIO98071.1 T-cell receptor beta chain ANA 11, putative [Brugia malayi]
MASTSRTMEERQNLAEGIVTYCDDRLARVWIETIKREKEINFAYRSRHFNLGDWLLVSLTSDEVHRISPILETRVLEIGVTQVRTEVIFRQSNEKIGHGIIIQSKHFDRVAVFAPFSGIIINRIYSVYVERIPRDRQWNEQESGTYWFVPSNQIPELVPISKYSANDRELVSATFVSHWPLNNLTADWIGPVVDRDNILEKAVQNFGVGQTYEVMLKRIKKSVEEPITTWNVCQVLDCINRSQRHGIVCFVDIQKSLSLVYIQDTNHGNGRMLHVNLKMFEAVPALGDWFSFEISESSQFWTVLSAVKSQKLCTSYISNGQLEVETEVILTDQISTKGHRIMFSVVLGAVVDDMDKLLNIPLDASIKYTVWCKTVQTTASIDPYWRITNFLTLRMKNRAVVPKPNLNTNAKNADDISYVGIVTGKCQSGYFIWTPSLTEIICYCKSGLHIGDWIQFWIRKKQRSHSKRKPFYINNWYKLDSCYPAREENNTAVVTVELRISENYNSRQPPSLPFFGKVLDKKHWFRAHIDDIRGHIIEIDIKHIRTGKLTSSWDITFVLVKRPCHGQKKSFDRRAVKMNANPAEIDAVVIPSIPSTSASTESAQNVDNGDLSIPVDNLFIDERRNYGNHSPTFYNGEKKAHDEDCYDGSDPQKDDTELDSVICSMKLLFMSKEVREAIKTNCSEEYTVLRQYFDFVP